MTEKTKWSHLPNAGHIDRVLASVKAHPEAWDAVWNTVWNTARDAAWDAVRSAVRDAARDAAWYTARDAAWDAARSAVRDAAWYTAWDTIAVLIAYDDCAPYLDMPSDQLRVWAILSEKPGAVLLLPAVTAFEKISELELA